MAKSSHGQLVSMLNYANGQLVTRSSHHQWRFYRGGMGWLAWGGWSHPKNASCHPSSHPKWKYELWYLVYTLYIWKLLVPPLAVHILRHPLSHPRYKCVEPPLLITQSTHHTGNIMQLVRRRSPWVDINHYNAATEFTRPTSYRIISFYKLRSTVYCADGLNSELSSMSRKIFCELTGCWKPVHGCVKSASLETTTTVSATP